MQECQRHHQKLQHRLQQLQQQQMQLTQRLYRMSNPSSGQSMPQTQPQQQQFDTQKPSRQQKKIQHQQQQFAQKQMQYQTSEPRNENSSQMSEQPPSWNQCNAPSFDAPAKPQRPQQQFQQQQISQNPRLQSMVDSWGTAAATPYYAAPSGPCGPTRAPFMDWAPEDQVIEQNFNDASNGAPSMGPGESDFRGFKRDWQRPPDQQQVPQKQQPFQPNLRMQYMPQQEQLLQQEPNLRMQQEQLLQSQMEHMQVLQMRQAQKSQQQQQQQQKQFQRGGGMHAMEPSGFQARMPGGGAASGRHHAMSNSQAGDKLSVTMPNEDTFLLGHNMADFLRSNSSSTGPGTMKAQLQALSFEDPGCVFIVRRINKLGFASSGQLQNHFAKYGEVKSVHVSHSRVKSLRPQADRRTPSVQWRLRAAALGFVVMQSRDAIQRILEDGPEHEVQTVMVRVHPFHRRCISENEPEAEGEPQGMEMGMLPDHFFQDLPAEQMAQQPLGGSMPMPHRRMQPFEDTTPQFQPVWNPLGMPYPSPDATIEGGAAFGMCEGMPLSSGLLYVSEQDLQDAMPAQYED